MEPILEGRNVWQFGDNYNADLIVGSNHITTTDKDLLGKVCLADYDPEFVTKVQPGDLMVAGRNFGYGHPHYQGIISLQRNHISTVIAESFYPMWFRVAVFYAFPALVCPGISNHASLGDRISPVLLAIIEDGGLPAHLKKRALAKTQASAA